MKKLIFSLLTTCFILTGHSQCEVNSFIQDNYTVDASILALRDILSDPSDPDYDNPFLPAERVIPYLEKLSAIYENPQNHPRIDSLFNEFQFHVNPVYNIFTEYKMLAFMVPTNTSWVQPLKNTGVSGYQELDDFFSLYQLTMNNFIDLTTTGNTIFYMETGFDFLNIEALLDDLTLFQNIISASTAGSGEFINYTGIPYIVEGKFGFTGQAEVCDILFNNNTIEFYLGANDCLAGCQAQESRYVTVSKDCQTVEFLSTPEFNISEISVYPNPTSDKIQIEHYGAPIKSYTIYSIEGKMQKTGSFQQTIDISTLTSGMFFIELVSEEGTATTKKFIKH
ncbi:MAG TPA: T9SS type A sorting domain-containing protein [Flavobacteriaceae bacterium]|nr:hypothetical protein [Flavobacteriaceae bacterium]HBR54990.1 hypothetical protein [Flavobacteriaceae bacterium]HIB47573.1 T9SS type A sorting domain-containing protein [Flavobacteriaceae bacterium]HIN98911.1 T9SS type A sorting domain-containing protein [Flavobacteriaceae bacterium]|tara:strand:+ start:1076 stop:2089 length:1014 start_codon:yes stop_codon:yes gene_type:complete